MTVVDVHKSAAIYVGLVSAANRDSCWYALLMRQPLKLIVVKMPLYFTLGMTNLYYHMVAFV